MVRIKVKLAKSVSVDSFFFCAAFEKCVNWVSVSDSFLLKTMVVFSSEMSDAHLRNCQLTNKLEVDEFVTKRKPRGCRKL